jgi:hypothetical protein
MKITEKNLQRIIQEETDQLLLEIGWSGDTIIKSIAGHGGIKFKPEQGQAVMELVNDIHSMYHTPMERKQFFSKFEALLGQTGQVSTSPGSSLAGEIQRLFPTPEARAQFFRWYSEAYDSSLGLRTRS